MGWKAVKDAYQIKHAVQVVPEKGICIGSPYVHDLAIIDMTTGDVRNNATFHNFVEKEYPALAKASRTDVLKLIETPDEFAASITVHTYDGVDIIEKQCEELGWPNVTHDGCMMYENTFSADKAQVVAWAKRGAASGVEWQARMVQEAENKVIEHRARLTQYETNRAKLDADYPDIEADAS